jgi:hypothetical protein
MQRKQIYVYMWACACVYVLSRPPTLHAPFPFFFKKARWGRVVSSAPGGADVLDMLPRLTFHFHFSLLARKRNRPHTHTYTRTHTRARAHTHTVGRDAVSAELMLAKRPSKPANCKLIRKSWYELFFFASGCHNSFVIITLSSFIKPTLNNNI